MNKENKLERFPLIPNDHFLAWDASDEYIIAQVSNNYSNLTSVLIIEDEFGAISLNIKADQIFCVNDSILSKQGILHNFQINQQEASKLTFLSPYQAFPDKIDLIILKLPKVNRYLEYLLNKLNSTYSSNTPLLAGSMLKYLNPSIYKLFQSYLAEFQYSLSWKKAKIITALLTGIGQELNFLTTIKEFDLTLINFPNLFSSQKLDIGTRFLLENLTSLPLPPNIENIIDVGSANGILGLSLFSQFPQANLSLTDITFSAYESALATIKESKLNSEKIELIIANGLDHFQADFADLIVINPPFHQNQKVSIATTLAIFADCAKVLKENGVLIVVANRHLGYHKHLLNFFSEVEILRENEKFFIISASGYSK